MGAQTFPPTSRTMAGARRIIVKVGSALIVDPTTGVTREPWLELLAEDVARLRSRGQDVAVVSSGAVAIGRHRLDLHQTMLPTRDRQAAAAVGQMHLTRMYREAFARYRLTTAQVLLTLNDTTERQRLLNVRACLIKLLTFQAIPVLNENDAIATRAGSFGDNDRLAARAARLIGSDTLVLLSNVAGLYSADPNVSSSGTLIREVHDVTPEIERMAGGARFGYSSGGMTAKLVAARMALASGCTVIIADGRGAHPLAAIDAGKPCTWFLPSIGALIARKTWIASALRPEGVVVVADATAIQLRLGQGLHIDGVTSFDGDFGRGDAIIVRDVHGNEVARGLSIYSNRELRWMTRRSRREAVASLTCCKLGQVIDGDDLALAN
ncbi:glutamate 5-kinase [Bradyrhizobium sp. CIR18]|uniref:glutamate 5-kinase n=1 Tax=Bradyrhizobium sp. CIR18 TaxID=2663839 RepID=UPI0016059D5D|nr:glutamate 5-kinase [Bradyrhizobium sp. CIR18]MBB4365270.1 glutamate 5-kinase [Bradyrhizobium sp. CIR18]